MGTDGRNRGRGRRSINVATSVNTAVNRGSGVSASRVVSRRRIVQRNGETVEETVDENTTEVLRGGGAEGSGA